MTQQLNNIEREQFETEKDNAMKIFKKRVNPNINTDILRESGGGNIHFRATQDMGKTMGMVRLYQNLIDTQGYSPSESVGNLHIGDKIDDNGYHYGGRYGDGYTAMKGDDLRQFLWEMTHVPLRHRIVMIDEIDSEFPARMFQDREQTKIMLRLWHNMKLRNYVLYTSHLGNGTDRILVLATQFEIIPMGVDWENDSLPITLINGMDCVTDEELEISNVHLALNNYDRWEMTEKTEEDEIEKKPISNAKKEQLKILNESNNARNAKSKFNSVKEDYFNSHPLALSKLRK